jgi:hypothetical protein
MWLHLEVELVPKTCVYPDLMSDHETLPVPVL